MSKHEALAAIKGHPSWLAEDNAEAQKQPAPPTAVDEAAALVDLAQYPGPLDEQSATWSAVLAWCAKQVITSRNGMELADRPDLRERIKVLRELMRLPQHQRAEKVVAESQEPFIP